MKNLLVIGAACADVMLRLDHLPITGEDINLQAQDIAMGGCGYNAAKPCKPDERIMPCLSLTSLTSTATRSMPSP